MTEKRQVPDDAEIIELKMNAIEPECDQEDSSFKIEPLKAIIPGRTVVGFTVYFQDSRINTHEAIIMAYPKMKNESRSSRD